MREWVELLYNKNIPPRRRIKMNGTLSPEFDIGSGVAQGCPLSPLLFLFIAEPLTRLILQDKELEGVVIGDHTHKIAQFADDTAAYLKDWDQLPRLFELVGRWESATARQDAPSWASSHRGGMLVQRTTGSYREFRTS